MPYKKSGKRRFLRRARGGAFLFSWQKDLFLQSKMGKTPVWDIRKANLPVGRSNQNLRFASRGVLQNARKMVDSLTFAIFQNV
ncbi:MAG: hypothetical protein MR881_09480, partial [Bacteroidales bacterium]|nr:hypothetical protein [Bacteroidales bacterium]